MKVEQGLDIIIIQYKVVQQQHKHHSLLNTSNATATATKSANTTKYTNGSLKQLRQLNLQAIYLRNI